MKNAEIIKSIGKKIRARRREKNITQKQLGKRLGVLTATVSAWELGKISPRLVTVIELEKILDCKLISEEETQCKN